MINTIFKKLMLFKNALSKTEDFTKRTINTLIGLRSKKYSIPYYPMTSQEYSDPEPEVLLLPFSSSVSLYSIFLIIRPLSSSW